MTLFLSSTRCVLSLFFLFQFSCTFGNDNLIGIMMPQDNLCRVNHKFSMIKTVTFNDHSIGSFFNFIYSHKLNLRLTSIARSIVFIYVYRVLMILYYGSTRPGYCSRAFPKRNIARFRSALSMAYAIRTSFLPYPSSL